MLGLITMVLCILVLSTGHGIQEEQKDAYFAVHEGRHFVLLHLQYLE
jgi:hypothetical protein